MEISKYTYIDTLLGLKMVSSSTRNKCVDRGIFAIKDLEQYLDSSGRIALRGFSTRSIIELQNAWDKACRSSASSSTNKPRKLTRILSQEEKSTISELEDLFESTYMGGCNVVKDNSSISNEHSITKATNNTVDGLDELSNKLIQQIDFNKHLRKFSDFITKYKRAPNLQANGVESEIARWLEYVFLHKTQFGPENQKIIQSMSDLVNALNRISL